MVSGFVISPQLHSAMRSGEASRIATAAKSCGMTSFFLICIIVCYLPEKVNFFGLLDSGMKNSYFSYRSPYVAHEFNVDAKPPQVPNEHVERGRRVRFLDASAGYDGVERRGAAENVVGLDGEYLAQRVCGSVAEERPHLHFPHALTAVLRLATERLLGGE